MVERLPERWLGEMGREGSVRTLRLVLLGLEELSDDRRFGKDERGVGTLLEDARVLPGVGEGMRWERTWRGLFRVALSSPRPISSKCATSPSVLQSSLWVDWKEEDLELFEVVMPGGDVGRGAAVSESLPRVIAA